MGQIIVQRDPVVSPITESDTRLGKWLSRPGTLRMILGGIITKTLYV